MKWLSRMAFAAALTGAGLFAGPITYTLTATATGTLGGTAFTDAAITVTSFADTSNVFLVSGSVYEVIATSSSISIAGFPTATFTDPMYWDDPQGSGDIWFIDDVLPLNGGMGFDNPLSGLVSYDLKSSFGPLSSSWDWTSIIGPFHDIPTSAGSLSLVASDDTFTAVTAEQGTPEPSTWALLCAGAFLILFRLRRTAPERS